MFGNPCEPLADEPLMAVMTFGQVLVLGLIWSLLEVIKAGSWD